MVNLMLITLLVVLLLCALFLLLAIYSSAQCEEAHQGWRGAEEERSDALLQLHGERQKVKELHQQADALRMQADALRQAARIQTLRLAIWKSFHHAPSALIAPHERSLWHFYAVQRNRPDLPPEVRKTLAVVAVTHHRSMRN